jgi:hypothetical protein
VRFTPTFDGIRACLAALAQGELPLVCRNPAEIDNSAASAGTRLWSVFEMAAARVPA